MKTNESFQKFKALIKIQFLFENQNYKIEILNESIKKC